MNFFTNYIIQLGVVIFVLAYFYVALSYEFCRMREKEGKKGRTYLPKRDQRRSKWDAAACVVSLMVIVNFLALFFGDYFCWPTVDFYCFGVNNE